MFEEKSALGVAVAGLIALLVVTTLIDPVALRATLSILAVAPIIYMTVRNAVRRERRFAKEQRINMALRAVTTEFILSVRNLNRLKIIAQEDEELIEAEEMIDEIVAQMHSLVDRIRSSAGQPVPEVHAANEA